MSVEPVKANDCFEYYGGSVIVHGADGCFVVATRGVALGFSSLEAAKEHVRSSAQRLTRHRRGRSIVFDSFGLWATSTVIKGKYVTHRFDTLEAAEAFVDDSTPWWQIFLFG